MLLLSERVAHCHSVLTIVWPVDLNNGSTSTLYFDIHYMIVLNKQSIVCSFAGSLYPVIKSSTSFLPLAFTSFSCAFAAHSVLPCCLPLLRLYIHPLSHPPGHLSVATLHLNCSHAQVTASKLHAQVIHVYLRQATCRCAGNLQLRHTHTDT